VVLIPPGRDENRIMEEFNSQLAGHFSVLRTTSPLDGESLWIEIFPPEISKSSGVRWIAERHGLTGAESAAVGNDYNDHDLLEWAGCAYVVRDSPEHLRTAFTEVTSAHRGAVAHAARLWLTERGQLSGIDSWPSP
jgi:hydroxymethylpyrimidine pyrophosphatase-like HAD family hydrolase